MRVRLRVPVAGQGMAEPAASHRGHDALVAPGAGEAVDAALSRELELLAHRAWPPLCERRVGGWVLRESAGSSRRGNSVWARGDVPDLSLALDEVRAFYAAAGLPATVQITPVSLPAGIHQALDTLGFDDTGPTDVCAADLADLAGRLAGGTVAEASVDVPSGASAAAAAGSGRAGGTRTLMFDDIDGSWLDIAGRVLSTFADQRAGTLKVLTNLTIATKYVLCVMDGVPVAVGRGVIDGDWLGVYSMATIPAARGRGAARAVLAGLVTWATDAGASRAYLQVEQTSTAARHLYAALGFQPVYRYSYRRYCYRRSHHAGSPAASLR
ncbi:GNAT family N-acetyltransferase [Frankia sp. Cj5]|uniref:GNAT family N-acetyltransferase n=1 Tax=Frankia sp. Cj5 TaxID=2880978 RepID=UPI001EF5D927|nr:GNAT family N-acetyltransferase [Frankia sp. Cj5]